MGKLVATQKMIYRQDLKNNPEILYLFGDNLVKAGMGGQAGSMRGEPNAVGIPTKVYPDMLGDAFFRNSDLKDFKIAVDMAFIPVYQHIARGGKVIIPEDGLGTGLSELPTRAPKCYAYLDKLITDLKTL